jgi:26S proteasome regulatory subunit N13
LIIFPEDATFKRLKQAPTGRVYLLEFKATSRKFFFWMQEMKEDKDEEIVTKINQYINNPPAPESQAARKYSSQ